MYQNQILSNLTIKSISEDNVTISGYASVYNLCDQHNDIIQKGAFDLLEVRNVKFLWQHDHMKPIGVIKELISDDHGLKVEAVINGKIAVGKEAIELVKQGALDGLSVGFHIKSTEYNSKGQRVIIDAELVEISVVTFPAQAKAQIHHILNNKENNMNNIDYQYNNHMTHPGFIAAESDIPSKMNILEKKLNNMEYFFAKPQITTLEDFEQKSAFNDYLRKGASNRLVQKSFSGDDDASGGVLLIPTLYEKIISELNAKSTMRQLASIQTISSNALDLILEKGKFASGWVAETQERPETDTSKLEQKRILVHELYSQFKVTQKLLEDTAIGLESWMLERLTSSFLANENEAFIKGDGKNKPKGILSYQDTVQKLELSKKNMADGLLELIYSLDEEYAKNASFLMNRATLSMIQKLKDAHGRFIWEEVLADPLRQTIFGLPVVCASDMPWDDKEKPAIAIGDFKAAYKIVDRKDIDILRDPYTSKPFIKFYAVKRVGGDLINPQAITFGILRD